MGVFLEGLPGSGKTTVMVSLAAALGRRCVAVPEVNPVPVDHHTSCVLQPSAHTRWYLERELRRNRLAATLAEQKAPVLAVFDRSYLSVLAYCWAKTHITGTQEWYEHARAIFDGEVRSHLDPAHTILLLNVTINTSLKRRRDKQDRSFEHDWYEPEFLDALNAFYSREAPTLCAGRLRTVNVEAVVQDRMLATVALALAGTRHGWAVDEVLDQTLVPRGTSGQLQSLHVRQYYDANGGLQVFGQPLGPPVCQAGGLTQFFERHAVQLTEGGKVRLFDPLAQETATP